MTFRTYPVLDEIYANSDLHQERLRRLWGLVYEGETVLSVGCNSASGAARFAPARARVYGVDLSQVAIERACSRLAGACIGDAARLPFATASMDIVMLGNILEYVPDPVEVLREARRVARRCVIGTTPHEDGYWGRSWFEAGQPVKEVDRGREMPRRYLTTGFLLEQDMGLQIICNARGLPAYHLFLTVIES